MSIFAKKRDPTMIRKTKSKTNSSNVESDALIVNEPTEPLMKSVSPAV